MRNFVVSATALLLVSGCSEYDLSAKHEPVEPALPIIQVTPSSIDFGSHAPGTELTEFFRIENVGENTLSLGDLELRGDDAFALTTEASGMDLEPGDSIDSMVAYIAGLDPSTGRVIIPSDDPANPEVKVPLNGGVAITDKPIAICSVDPAEIIAITDTATLIGDQSYDPNGLAITEVQWTGVVRPPGSNATVPAGSPTSPNRPGFRADVVGTYGFQLVVTNEAGVASDPCLTELEAIPGEDLWVEMYWTTASDDMDLHLTRAGANTNSFSDDCYFSNCTGNGLDWGPAGPAGNPVLDLDDIPGTGPENINVHQPENIIYNVHVHDHTSRNLQAANSVTVNVYLSGSLAFSDTRSISGENSFTHFADIDWANQTVIPR